MDALTFFRTIPSASSPMLAAMDDIVKLAKEMKWNDDAVFALRMGLDEAISNAIRHGNKSNPDKQVEIEVAFAGRSAHIRILDQGEGFDPAKVPDPRQPENLDRPGGRGLLLIRAYMKKVDWNPKGNQIQLHMELPE